MSDLEEHLNKIEDIEYTNLPFYHTCDMDKARDILKSNKISPNYCNRFLEDILYLFLGKSSYKKDAEMTQERYFPVSFCINPNVNINIVRSYPLDTGAIELDIYYPFITKEKFEVAKQQYNLGITISACYKFILSCFEKLEYYIENNPIKSYTDSGLPNLYEVKEIYNIYTQTYGKKDMRCLTVEVQSKEVIELNKANILGILYPSILSNYPNTTFLDESLMYEPLIYSEAYGATCSRYYDYIYIESQKISKNYLTKNESN